MRAFLLPVFIAVLCLPLQGCLIGTVVGAAADVAIEVVKVPFKVAGAVVDVVSDSDEEKAAKKKKKEEEEKAEAEAKAKKN